MSFRSVQGTGDRIDSFISQEVAEYLGKYKEIRKKEKEKRQKHMLYRLKSVNETSMRMKSEFENDGVNTGCVFLDDVSLCGL